MSYFICVAVESLRCSVKELELELCIGLKDRTREIFDLELDLLMSLRFTSLCILSIEAFISGKASQYERISYPR